MKRALLSSTPDPPTARARRMRDDPAHFVPGNRVRFVPTAPEGLEAMAEAIAHAQREVLLEMYWFDTDAVGTRFLELLCDAARREVRVIVCYDDVGSWGTSVSFFAPLLALGGEVHCYNPVSWMPAPGKLERLSLRDHRKLVLVDGQLGLVGGINLSSEWASRASGGGGFYDHCVSVSGPVAAELRRAFASTYQAAASRKLPALERAPTEQGEVPVAVLSQHRWRRRRGVLSSYLYRIRHARRSILIANAYFIPTRRVMRALVAAARRGVEVRVLLPRVSDIPVVDYASKRFWPRLLSAGVRLYLYRDAVLHTKTACIDSSWVTTGSFNLDHLSIRNNRELNVAMVDTGVGAQVERLLRVDMQASEEVSQESFARRPVWHRLIERVAYTFHKWL